MTSRRAITSRPQWGRSQREAPATAGPPAEASGHDTALARRIRARCLVAGLPHAHIADEIHSACAPVAGTTWIRAYRLALGISLGDVVAQVKAWYASEGRPLPKFSETLLSAYESGQKRPGPEYLHYLSAVYRAEPSDLGYPDQCFCGRTHRHGVAAAPRGAAVPRSATRPCLAAPPAYPGHAIPAPAPAARPPDAGAAEAGAVGSGPAGAGAAAHAGAAHGGAAGAAPGGGRPAGAGDGTLGEAAAPAGVAAAAPASVPGHGPPPEPWPLAPPALAPPPAGTENGEAAEQRETDTADDDLLRRVLLRMMTEVAIPVDGPFLGAVDRIRRRMDEALVGGTVSATMLDQWEETTAGYGRQYMTVPPLRLLCDVLLDFGDVRRMCEHRQPLDASERLCRLAAQLAGLAGMIMIDLGDQRLARSFFRTARTAADETGDRHLRAWVTVREALVPLYYGDPSEASTLARAAAGLAGHRPCVAGVMGPVLEARSLTRAAGGGRVTDKPRVRALLGRAHGALASLSDDERDDTAYGYTERQLLFHEGDALVSLGFHRAAEEAFTHALQLYSPAEFLDRSLIGFGLARCRVAAGEPEQALRLSKETLLGAPPEHRSEIMVRTARSLGDAVAGRYGDLRAVSDYREALANR